MCSLFKVDKEGSDLLGWYGYTEVLGHTIKVSYSICKALIKVIHKTIFRIDMLTVLSFSTANKEYNMNYSDSLSHVLSKISPMWANLLCWFCTLVERILPFLSISPEVSHFHLWRSEISQVPVRERSLTSFTSPMPCKTSCWDTTWIWEAYTLF